MTVRGRGAAAPARRRRSTAATPAPPPGCCSACSPRTPSPPPSPATARCAAARCGGSPIPLAPDGRPDRGAQRPRHAAARRSAAAGSHALAARDAGLQRADQGLPAAGRAGRRGAGVGAGAARPLPRPHRAAAARLRLPGGGAGRLDRTSSPTGRIDAVRHAGPGRSLLGGVSGRRGGAGRRRASSRITRRVRQPDPDRLPRGAGADGGARSRWTGSRSSSASRWPIWSPGRPRSRATEVRAGEIPGLIDEIPMLAALATRAEGTTVFRDVGELRVKESDRLGLIAENIRAVGGSGRGVGATTSTSPAASARRPGRVRTEGDHRLAMAFAVLGTLPGAKVRVDDLACAAVSYPGLSGDAPGDRGGPLMPCARHRDRRPGGLRQVEHRAGGGARRWVSPTSIRARCTAGATLVALRECGAVPGRTARRRPRSCARPSAAGSPLHFDGAGLRGLPRRASRPTSAIRTPEVTGAGLRGLGAARGPGLGERAAAGAAAGRAVGGGGWPGHRDGGLPRRRPQGLPHRLPRDPGRAPAQPAGRRTWSRRPRAGRPRRSAARDQADSSRAVAPLRMAAGRRAAGRHRA